MPPSLAVVPAWVVPNPTEVRDCHLIAYRAFQESRAPGLGGSYAAVNWVTGGQRAPVTERIDPLSEALVRAEMWVAQSVGMRAPLPSDLWVRLGVEPREARTTDTEWTGGVSRTLGWLVGVHDRPPFPLPRRPVPSAEELYAEAVAARPYAAWEPEQQLAARQKAEADAHKYRKLAEYVDGLPYGA
jgi:hypothetical protein